MLVMFCTLPASAAVTITGAGFTVSVDPAGQYDIAFPAVSWKFSGNIGAQLTNVIVSTGVDTVGAYSEIGFDFVTDAVRHAAIRGYSDRPDVMFLSNTPFGAPNTFTFPNFTQFPRNLDHVTFSGIFAPPSFWDLAAESPWVFFDSSFNSFIVSPAANYMTAATKWGSRGELTSGISTDIASLPGGFEHRTLL